MGLLYLTFNSKKKKKKLNMQSDATEYRTGIGQSQS